METKQPKGLALASLIIGIVSAVFALIPVVNIFTVWVFGIPAVILGVVALIKKQPKGKAWAGIVLSVAAYLIYYFMYAAAASAAVGAAANVAVGAAGLSF